MLRKNRKGFTLIELLVVITIIGILATGAVTVYTSQIQKARDSTRLTDIKAVQGAVEQVYQDKWSYPKAADLDDFKADVANYMPNVPEDSKHGSECEWDTTCGYVYNVWNSEADDSGINDAVYELSFWFESSWNHSSKGDADNGNDDKRFEVSNNSSRNIATSWDPSATAPANWIAIVTTVTTTP